MSRPKLDRRHPCFALPVTPDDLVRHALAAYYVAVRNATPDPTDPDPTTWSDAQTFLQDLLQLFELRVWCSAAADGYPVDVSADAHERLARIQAEAPVE